MQPTPPRTRLLGLWILGLTIALPFAVAGATIPLEPLISTAARIAIIAITAAIAILTFTKGRREDSARRAAEHEKAGLQDELDAERVRILTVTNSVFQVIAQRVNDMAVLSPSKRSDDIKAFRQMVLDKAVELVKCEAPRASYFRLERRTPRRLVHNLSAYRSRTDETTRVFVEGNDEDQGVWRILQDNGAELVKDLDVDAPADFSRQASSIYRTHITLAVSSGGVGFGIFTINALRPGDLNDEDLPSMRVLARLLGAAEGLALTPKQIRALSKA